MPALSHPVVPSCTQILGKLVSNGSKSTPKISMTYKVRKKIWGFEHDYTIPVKGYRETSFVNATLIWFPSKIIFDLILQSGWCQLQFNNSAVFLTLSSCYELKHINIAEKFKGNSRPKIQPTIQSELFFAVWEESVCHVGSKPTDAFLLFRCYHFDHQFYR